MNRKALDDLELLLKNKIQRIEHHLSFDELRQDRKENLIHNLKLVVTYATGMLAELETEK